MNGDKSSESRPQFDGHQEESDVSNNITRNLQKNQQVSFRLPLEGSRGSFYGSGLDSSDRSHGSRRRGVPRFTPSESGDILLNNNNKADDSSPDPSPRSNYHNHRPTDSIRAVERKGVRGRAGGNRARLMAYLEERTSNLFSARKNRENFPNVADQYYIPPPEETEDCSVFAALGQLYTGAFDDLSMWLYGASFWKILVSCIDLKGTC